MMRRGLGVVRLAQIKRYCFDRNAWVRYYVARGMIGPNEAKRLLAYPEATSKLSRSAEQTWKR